MKILCLNCGSSSMKYKLYDWEKKETLAAGNVERVGIGGSFIVHDVPGQEETKIEKECPTHKEAIQLALDTLMNGVIKSTDEISAVGHRVVHGGEKFAKSVIITKEVLEEFKNISDLAPLHNPANILGIEAAFAVMPNIQHMAIMDTAWHQTMPEHAYIYALPYQWYEKYGVRRYGFHGTSFLYNAKRAAALLNKNPFDCNLIIAHIGNGASINAVKKGVSYDTSMGMTPLEGLIMGTRAGDHDAAIDFFMMKKENIAPADMENILNKKSGILGITEKYTDRRDVEQAAEKGDKRAQLTIEMEGYRIKKYIGSYMAALGQVDAIIFTAGVGELGHITREHALKGLEELGVKIDDNRNKKAKTRNAESLISAPDSKVKVFVIPTDEEIVFIEDVVALKNGTYNTHDKFEYTFAKKDYRNKMRDEQFKLQLQKKPWLKEAAINTPEGV